MVRSGLALLIAAAGALAQNPVVVRPAEIDDVLVNPEMGIQTFQRVNGDAINAGRRWSEAGPTDRPAATGSAPDFPESSIAYYRWFWSQLEPEQGKYVWTPIDLAIERARSHGQKLDFRLMPYDQSHPLPEWYHNSGARRANKAGDADGAVWSPDADDPQYVRRWGAFIAAAGKRYNGHPDVNQIDISTVGYWGEGWGPYLPGWSVQEALIDQYFTAFDRTGLLMNFDEPRVNVWNWARRGLAAGLLGRSGRPWQNDDAHAGLLSAAGRAHRNSGSLAAQSGLSGDLRHAAVLERVELLR